MHQTSGGGRYVEASRDIVYLGGIGQVASSACYMRIEAGVPGIGVKLALCELEHILTIGDNSSRSARHIIV